MLVERALVETSPDAEPPALAARAAEYRCGDCGYGAMLRHALPICPMCGGFRWEPGAEGPPARHLAV